MDASLEWCSTPPLWHTKAVGGRPPHQGQTVHAGRRGRVISTVPFSPNMGQLDVCGSEDTIEFAPLEYAWGQGRDRLTGQDVLAAVERRRRQFSKPSSAHPVITPRERFPTAGAQALRRIRGSHLLVHSLGRGSGSPVARCGINLAVSSVYGA